MCCSEGQQRCKQTIVDERSLCAYHGKYTDVRAVGRRGGSRVPGSGGQNGKSLRTYLQGRISHEAVAKAIEEGLACPDDRLRLTSARVVVGEVYPS